MKNLIKLLPAIIALIIILISNLTACTKTQYQPVQPPSAQPAPVQPKVTPEKITLADSPKVLDLSPLLPANFEHLDAASEGMSNRDMELGPECSEVELFLSPEPYQMIYGFMAIITSRIEQAGTDAIFKDEQKLRSLLAEYIVKGAAEEGLELDVSDIKTDITYPQIGDMAVLGEGYIRVSGIDAGYDILWFRSNKVYVFLYSFSLSAEKQPLYPLAREILHRISMFSQ